MLQDIAAILETCLEQITAGRATTQECLDQYPDLVGELEPLLRAAERAQAVDRPSLAPEARARVEARFLAAAESIPSVQPVRSPHPTIALTWRRVAIRLALLCACICFLGIGLVTAAGSALPDSPLYPVKRTMEKVWLWLAPAQPVPTPLARITTLSSPTPEPSGTPVSSSTPTTTDGSQEPTEVPQPTAMVKLTTTPGPAAMIQPTGLPEPTGVLVPTRTPAATVKPGATGVPTETPRPTETIELAETPIPLAATATTVPSTAMPESQVCVYGLGYWKNHPDVWTVDSLILGNEIYTQAELLGLLNEPTMGDASLILAQQLIAARLNVANGADNSTIAATIAAADT
ncbi:MAG: hypothetical protein V3T90_13735 [Anaerolineae bacterium]